MFAGRCTARTAFQNSAELFAPSPVHTSHLASVHGVRRRRPAAESGRTRKSAAQSDDGKRRNTHTHTPTSTGLARARGRELPRPSPR